MIRCKSGNLLNAISTNLDNVLGVLSNVGKPQDLHLPMLSLSSSLMDI